MSNRGPKRGTVNNPKGINQYTDKLRNMLPSHGDRRHIDKNGNLVIVEKTLLGKRVTKRNVKREIAAEKEASNSMRRLNDKIARENRQNKEIDRKLQKNADQRVNKAYQLRKRKENPITNVIDRVVKSRTSTELARLNKENDRLHKRKKQNNAQKAAYKKAYAAKARKQQKNMTSMFSKKRRK